MPTLEASFLQFIVILIMSSPSLRDTRRVEGRSPQPELTQHIHRHGGGESTVVDWARHRETLPKHAMPPVTIPDIMEEEKSGALTRDDARQLYDQLQKSVPWTCLDVRECLAIAGQVSTTTGLTQEQVNVRKSLIGDNSLGAGKIRSKWSIIVGQFMNVITVILGSALIITLINGDLIGAGVIFGIIVVNGSVSAKQEIKALKSLEAIKDLAGKGMAHVIRDSKSHVIPIEDIVIGDVVEMRMGQHVPADVRLTYVNRMDVDEAILTGESVPVGKITEVIVPESSNQSTEQGAGHAPQEIKQDPSAATLESGTLRQRPSNLGPNALVIRTSFDPKMCDVPVGDRLNMAFRQTVVTQGYAVGVVIAVGKATQIGLISESLADVESTKARTQLDRSLHQMLYWCLFAGIVSAIIVFWAFAWSIDEESLLYASALLVAVLPEATILMTTLTISLGTQVMAKKNAIVRKLASLENLGKVTDVCSDKTGTLTMGKMNPARVVLWVDGHCQTISLTGPYLSRKAEWCCEGDAVELKQWLDSGGKGRVQCWDRCMAVCALCNSTNLHANDDQDTLVGSGNPTDLALMLLVFKAAAAVGDMNPVPRMTSQYEPRGEWLFDSKTKMMSKGWRHRVDGECIVVTKGAPERVIPLSNNIGDNEQDIMNLISNMANDGLRVLAIAIRTDVDLTEYTVDDYAREDIECDLEFVGLVAVRDPPKPESRPAVEACKRAGITPRMLTGDHKDTAVAIAKEIGILPPTGDIERYVTTGSVLDRMAPEELDVMAELPLVVARSSPQSKVIMIEALHRRKRVVAMTGDGVNDSPAIKEADVGIAMGITGSDVTKSVADIVLADDNFATIVSAVSEGRRISDSITKFVIHQIAGNVAEVIVLLTALSFVKSDGVPVFVLSPIAILWLNMATTSGPAIGLAKDSPARDIMLRPPQKGGLFTRRVITDVLVYGVMMGAFVLSMFSLVLYASRGGDIGTGCNTEDTDDDVDCEDVMAARGAAFLLFNVLFLFVAYNVRDLHRSAFSRSWTKNKTLFYSFVFVVVGSIAVLYIPYVHDQMFLHMGMRGYEWAMVISFMALFLVLMDLYKRWKWGYFM